LHFFGIGSGQLAVGDLVELNCYLVT
jgi:hypothetical protein